MFSRLRVLAGERVERGSMRSRFLRGVATDSDINFTIWLICASTKIPFVLKLGWNFLSYLFLLVQNWETTEDVCGIAKWVKKERRQAGRLSKTRRGGVAIAHFSQWPRVFPCCVRHYQHGIVCGLAAAPRQRRSVNSLEIGF